MNPVISIGKSQINAYQFAVQGNIILGTRGAGKTTAGKFLAESLMDLNIPIVVIDPISKWKFLKESNSNNPAGKSYPVIVVGNGGDVELSPNTIENVMRVALRNRASVVIDLFDPSILEYWDEIVTKIVKVLLYENEQYGLRHVFFEEASEFIHQNGKKTEASVWIERLVRLSGNVKVGTSFINQNAESISKAVVKLCDGRIVGRQTEKNSIDMARKWLAGSGVSNAVEISETLPTLKAGEFWIWSTSDNNPMLVQIPDIKSLHPSRNDMNYMDVKEMGDMSSILNEMNYKEEITFPVYEKPVIKEYVLPELQQEPEVMLPEINLELLSAYDRNIVMLANRTPFGSGTVKSTIDTIVKKGYIVYKANPYWLQTPDGSKTFGLNSETERRYAKIITELVNEKP